jgi:hypothetical protein
MEETLESASIAESGGGKDRAINGKVGLSLNLLVGNSLSGKSSPSHTKRASGGGKSTRSQNDIFLTDSRPNTSYQKSISDKGRFNVHRFMKLNDREDFRENVE